MNWKNMMNKNNWVFQQVELIESNGLAWKIQAEDGMESIRLLFRIP